MNLRERLVQRIELERQRAEASYAEADKQVSNVLSLEKILAEGSKKHWRMALEAYK